MQSGDASWGEYNRKSCEYMASGQWGKYQEIRFQMFLQLLDEKRYLDSFLMLSEVFMYCMDGDAVPYIQDKYIRYAQQVFTILEMPSKKLSKNILERLEPQYTPFKFYTKRQVVDVFLLYASGDRNKASEIFCRHCPNTHKWLEKSHKLNQESLAAQDRQLRKVQATEAKYKETGDLDWYVDFWENLWANGGLLFYSSKWWFVLPDLYFKQKRFDDVISFCEILKGRDKYAEDKADKYIQRAQERKAKLKK